MSRITEVWDGCGTPRCMPIKGLGSVAALPSGQYMGAVGKVVGMSGLSELGAVTISPTGRAMLELGRLGGQRQPVQILTGCSGLGSAADYRACSGISQAAQSAFTAGGTINASQPRGGDQGWGIAAAVGQLASGVANALCQTIDNGIHAAPPPGQVPDPGLQQQMMMLEQQRLAAEQRNQMLLYGGVAVAVIVGGVLLLRK